MVNLRVNGEERAFDGDASMPLLWYLRDELGLTGTKFGCGQALCGACTVHLDGDAIRACQIMQAAALLRQTPTPSDRDIDEAMFGNICRCGTYQRIRAAIKQAAGGA